MSDEPRRRLEPLRIHPANPPIADEHAPQAPAGAATAVPPKTARGMPVIAAVLGCAGLAAIATAAGVAFVLPRAGESAPGSAASTADGWDSRRSAPPAPTCDDCAYPGTRCDDGGKCRLAPGARWAVSPWIVTFKPQPGMIYGGSGGVQPSLCVRKRDASEWACAEFDDKHGRGGSHSGDNIVFSGAPRIVVTTEELLGAGIDLEVRSWGDAQATRLGARHEEGLVAGKLLFNGGLKFGLPNKSFPIALVKLEPTE